MDIQNTLEFSGAIAKHTCAELFAEISQAKISGSLRLSRGKEKIIAYFESGDVVFAVSNSRDHRLFEILLSEGVVPEEKLVKIDGFIHDLHLAKEIVAQELVTQNIVESIFSIQIKQIIQSAWLWEKGIWIFSPLARAKDGVRFTVDLPPSLRRYAKKLPPEEMLNRFKSYSEEFYLNEKNLNVSNLNPTPNEAFVLSRIGEDALKIDELRSMSGLDKEELFGILYRLWMGRILNRKNWSSFFSDEDIQSISDAKLTLKKSASSFEEEREKARQEEEEKRREEETARKIAEEKRMKERAAGLTLETYLKRVEDAATHYELFGLDPDADISRIKKVYFAYAKNFHPDLFHNEVEEEKHREIQNAFTEIAKAYDTLKDNDAREVYDFKLRKVIETARKAKKAGTGPASSPSNSDFESHKKASAAASEFESGYNHLMNNNFIKALPHLERAATLDAMNARYHAYFGKALACDQKQKHRAENELQKAVRLDGNHPEYRVMLAEFYVEIGLKARAKGELNKLLADRPGYEEAQSLLDRLSGK